MTTLLAMFRRPDGGPEALAEFERRYATEHLPLVAATPGLRETRVRRVADALGGATDLVLMRAAGRNLREIAPGLVTLFVLEDLPEMDRAASASVDTVGTTREGAE